jgi:hypothetical protein
MVEDMGDIRVNDETKRVIPHLCFLLQFFGFSGSSGPSHVTCATPRG